MEKQEFQVQDADVVRKFVAARKSTGNFGNKRLNLSWSNWGFGMEPFEQSAARLEKNGIRFIELHGNLYGPDLGYKASEVKKILKDHGIAAAGICGMVSRESEFSSTSHVVRQRCIDYFRRHIEFCKKVGGKYILFAAGAVGRPVADDDNEFRRAADTMRIVAEDFRKSGITAGIEPVRKDEVSLVHTFEEATALIKLINHPGIQHIAGDVFHMLLGEKHIGETIIAYGDRLCNLHLADTNRRALGTGMMDIDILVMSLYAARCNRDSFFATPEPLGGGGDPYTQMYGYPAADMLDELVRQTASTFYKREKAVLEASDEELKRTYNVE